MINLTFLKTFFIVLVIVLTWAQPVAAQDALYLDDLKTRYDVNSSQAGTGVFPTPSDVNLDELINRLNSGQLSPKAEARPNFLKNSTYSAYIPIENNTNSTNWVLHVSAFLIDQIDIYIIDENNEISLLQSYELHLDAKSYENNLFSSAIYKSIMGRGLAINLPTDKPFSLYLEMTANSEVPLLHLALMSPQKYTEWTSKLSNFFFLGLGIAIGLIVIAFIAGIVLRDNTLYWFGASSTLLLGITVLRSNIGVETIHSSSAGPPDWIVFYVCATLICMMVFVEKFLVLKEEADWWSTLFKAFILVTAILAIVSLFINISTALFLFVFIGLPAMCLIIVAGIVKTIRVGKYYLIFMFGWIPVLLYTISNVHFGYGHVELGESTLRLHVLEDIYYKVTHTFFHLIAIIIKILDIKKEKIIAETNSKAKTRFLASLSHDLRQPLHTMKLLLSHLRGEIASKEGSVLLDKLTDVHESTNETFNALIDWSKLDAGEVQVCKETTAFSGIFNSIHSEFEPQASAKGITLHFRPTQQMVFTDPILLKRILRNLVSNAIKYTDSGKVLVALRKRKKAIHVEVWDSGMGISKSEEAIIFDVYRRAEQTEHKYSGAGIGLASVKQLADTLGFSVTLKSLVNKGSRFTLLIPVEYTEIQKEVDKNKSLEQTLDLLPISKVENIIQDESLRDTIDHYLTEWGYETELSSSANGSSRKQTRVLILDEISILSKHINSTPDEKIHVAMYSQSAQNPEPQGVPASAKIYRLNPAFNPAELRSLLRFTDSLGQTVN